MLDFTLHYNNKKNTELKLNISKRPDMPTPERAYTAIDIPGKGTVYEDMGYYNDLELSFEMWFGDTPETWQSKLREVKQWLLGEGNNALLFSDDPDFFYKVKHVSMGVSERIMWRYGKFTAVFICDPYSYYVSGKDSISIPETLTNPGVLCKPIYKLSGSGETILSVNGKSVLFDFKGFPSQVDTDKMLIYNHFGSDEGAEMTGNFEDLWLKPGENTLTVTGATSTSMIPQFKTL